ncbi:FAD-dependent protein [Proteinivorax hydrogeniformans]|uniref:FAD-dependent protein n=1 Tax=Proteinivorax hydrogeniformans TaxID=1826727 RepID=A0AAU8HRJ3_9FIRM
MIRINNIKIAADKKQDIKKAVSNKLRISKDQIKELKVFKKSIDARRKDIFYVYNVDVEVKNEHKYIGKGGITKSPNLTYQFVKPGNNKLLKPIVVVGAGPAGLFCGLVLAQMGYKPIILEQGEEVDRRVSSVEGFWNGKPLNPRSNVQFGEGGAGTFSDGKLTTQIKDPRCRKVLDEMVKCGAPEEITFMSKPHVGTDKLRKIVKNLRQAIFDLGGQVIFDSQVTDILIENGKISKLEVNGGKSISVQAAVLALGHSARETFELLYKKGVQIKPKPFSVGVRIEHPQNLINLSQYGEDYEKYNLPAADYKLNVHLKDKPSVYTFCMCPGGKVVAAASEKGHLVTNGMSYYNRDEPNANSAVLVNVMPENLPTDHPLKGMFFQRELERKAFELGGADYSAPAQLVKDFVKGVPSDNFGEVVPSYKPSVKLTDLHKCLPDFVTESLREGIVELESKLNGFSLGDAVLTAVESRSSSPIRIFRTDALESNIAGLYPAGEGAGYAGGIMSAAVDGIKVAEQLASKYAPIKIEEEF